TGAAGVPAAAGAQRAPDIAPNLARLRLQPFEHCVLVLVHAGKPTQCGSPDGSKSRVPAVRYGVFGCLQLSLKALGVVPATRLKTVPVLPVFAQGASVT
ncbi:MAG: hypothetical protein ACREUU_01500, partial [Gammaproteobacteria bacterium]